MASALFQECIEQLSPYITILSQEKTDVIFDTLESMFPVGMASRIMWEEVDASYYTVLEDTSEICSALQKLVPETITFRIYILWNNASVPVIEKDLYTALSHIDDIICVASDTWFFNTKQGYVVEFYHLNRLTVGISSQKIAQFMH